MNLNYIFWVDYYRELCGGCLTAEKTAELTWIPGPDPIPFPEESVFLRG